MYGCMYVCMHVYVLMYVFPHICMPILCLPYLVTGERILLLYTRRARLTFHQQTSSLLLHKTKRCGCCARINHSELYRGQLIGLIRQLFSSWN